jgi:hypothetical protein
MILDLSASVMAAVGLFWLVQAFVTGRARGVWQTAERARQPALFWLNVAVLVSFVASSSSYLAWTAVTHGVVGSTFQARHPLTLGRDMPELPVEAVRSRLPGAGAPSVLRDRWRRPGRVRRRARAPLFYALPTTRQDADARRADETGRRSPGRRRTATAGGRRRARTSGPPSCHRRAWTRRRTVGPRILYCWSGACT